MPEKKWFFDTVALSNFLLSDAMFILERRYGRSAVITWQVYDELSAGFAGYPGLKRVDGMIDAGMLKRTPLEKKEIGVYLGLVGHLGKGESSCIAAAKVRSGIVVTDDRAARTMCRQLGIPVTGTIGMLKAPVTSGQVSLAAADSYLREMINAGFYSPVLKIADIV